MTPLTLCIVATFVGGYACIALESILRVNKAAIALMMMVVCWTLFAISPGENAGNNDIGQIIETFLGETATTLFFLMGAMTIVEVVDRSGGFNFVRHLLKTSNKRALLWRIAVMTFLLSAILDNLTTSIVMIMLLRKLVPSHVDRMIYGAVIIVAANSGGAFSPIGDVTTIMLWNMNLVTASGIILKLLLPSLVSMVIPVALLQFMLNGELSVAMADGDTIDTDSRLTDCQRKAVFILGVGGLISVPVFRAITGLSPFMGILLVLAVLWITTEVFYRNASDDNEHTTGRVGSLLSHIDMATILFFLGILMAVNCLRQIGVLSLTGEWLDRTSGGNHYIVTAIIGVLSSIVDNVPLVAGCIGMYPVAEAGAFAIDGVFWQLLAYCAGVGGSILIIGSAAGVVVMGLEKISFGWYMRHITPVVIAGYLAGMVCYMICN